MDRTLIGRLRAPAQVQIAQQGDLSSLATPRQLVECGSAVAPRGSTLPASHLCAGLQSFCFVRGPVAPVPEKRESDGREAKPWSTAGPYDAGMSCSSAAAIATQTLL